MRVRGNYSIPVWTDGYSQSVTQEEDPVTYDLELTVGPYTFPARSAGPPDGKIVLLLHGFPESSWEWHDQIAELASAGYRAVAPEQRGYSSGARPDRVEDYSIDFLVDDVIGMADDLGANTFHLVGHDWGAIVAWHVVAVHPKRLETLTIVSVPHPTAWAAAFADPASDQPQRSAYMPEMKRVGSEEGMAWTSSSLSSTPAVCVTSTLNRISRCSGIATPCALR